jgi:hypothetical protein
MADKTAKYRTEIQQVRSCFFFISIPSRQSRLHHWRENHPPRVTHSELCPGCQLPSPIIMPTKYGTIWSDFDKARHKTPLTVETRKMMYVSGETAEASPETTGMIEEIVRQQVIEMVSQIPG